ncbi:deoxynucleotide monophosphate kinase [Chelatococcus sp. GCM10030263]|uniref:deoxynucleotide monophosphate kinase family protein n=1 Tax=Chelatococcus sp. GCM10030263 TaxID=3273387 RepID=UPI00361D3EC3
MIIGLMGYAGAGKSTVARHLCAAHGFVAPHIGRPLKRMLGALLDEIGYDAATIARYVDGDLKRSVIPELGITATEAQQTLGTEWGRDCVGRDFWLSLWLAKADRIVAAGGNVVQESVRFANEVEALRARGAMLIEVRRPGVGPLSGHTSEEIPAEPDHVLLNDSAVEALHGRSEELLAAVPGK